jgi:hypothetical protein
MPIAKTTAEPIPAVDVRKRRSRLERPEHEPGRQLEFLSLEIEDDAGSDPYNRTGQHCVAELKNFER